MHRTIKTLLSAIAITMATCSQAAEYTAGITIDSRVKYQHVTGFGGFSPSPQWSYWLGDTEMDRLYGKGTYQMGYNILRIYIGNTRSSWAAGVANAKRAKQHGAFVFASPWSPPAEWKSNKSDSNGGYLLEEHYEDWARFLNDYYLYMKQQGVTIDAVSIQNEPDWNASYQSCIWTGEQLAKFLREYGHLIECKIIAPEAIHFTKNMHEPILNDAAACAELDILGGHFYGWDGSSYPLAAQKGKEVWMTEYLINERQQNNNININWQEDGFLFARSINDAMLANFSAWVHYSLKRYYGCLGDGTYGTTNNSVTKRGYILSHYAKYVSGTTRIRHSINDATGKLTASSYLTATGDSVVVMVLNPSENTYTTTLDLPFYTLSQRHIVTSETKSTSLKITTLTEETYKPVVTIDPYTVNTYIYKKSSARTDIPEDDPSAVVTFADNFDMTGASCIPPGWRSKSEEGIRYAGNYSLGPRIMSFSSEGLMQYGFYFRTGTAENGYVSYGEETNYRLALKPGKYTLSYSVVGWKALPSVSATVQKQSGITVKTLISTPQTYISGNGASVRITETTDKSMDFEVTEAGNYILKWNIGKASGGYNEALVGNIRLVFHDETGIQGITDNAVIDSQDETVYDLLGRKATTIRRGGMYIRGGKKFIAR